MDTQNTAEVNCIVETILLQALRIEVHLWDNPAAATDPQRQVIASYFVDWANMNC